MGLVFEAHHKFTRRTVALKLLPDELRAKKEARGRLLREAHALTAVRHPGFVEVLDAGVCATTGPYVVLEMLEGRTLDGLLAARERLSITDTVQIGRQMCDAIAHAHSRGVIHRDLKPSNIFISRNEIGDETVKLIDLGVAGIAEEQLDHLDHKLTTAHEVLGTPEYMAPEQLWGREVDARTDVYAIGMSLYECLTGQVPYAGAYPDVVVQVSNATSPPSVRDKRADAPPALAIVIEHSLEKEASARFQTASELGRALVAASGLQPGPSLVLSLAPGEVEPEAPADEEPERAIKLVKKKKKTRTASGANVARSPPSHRRHALRAPYVTPVVLLSATGSAIEARSEEISEEGMLVLTPLSFPLGAPVKLRFACPMTGEMVTIDGSVRWTREGRGRSAVGVEFVEPPAALCRVVSEYIAMLPVARLLSS
jgi:serine/threonine-protein kinase